MALDLEQISNAFESGDFARPNLFEVEIPFLGKNFKFKCRAASLPAGTTGNIQVSYQNRKINIGGDREYDTWTITVYNDSDHDTRDQFIDWHSQVQSMGATITGETPETYKKNGLVRQFDRKGDETKVVNMIGMKPENVGEITLDWDTNNEIETFEVTIRYDWWE